MKSLTPDISGMVLSAINQWFTDLVAAALHPIDAALTQIVLSTPRFDREPSITSMWTAALAAVDVIYVLFVIAGGLIVMSHETLQTSYGLKEILPRLVIGFLTANTSLLFAGWAIQLANGLSSSVAGDRDLTKSLVGSLLAADGGNVFFTLFVLVLTVMALVVTATMVIRIVLVAVLVAAAPLMLACHALPQTDGIARAWWRAMAAAIGTQLAQGLLLVAASRLFLTERASSVLGFGGPHTLLNLILLAALLYVMIRIPGQAVRLATGRRHHNPFTHYARYQLLQRGMSTALAAFPATAPLAAAGHVAGRARRSGTGAGGNGRNRNVIRSAPTRPSSTTGAGGGGAGRPGHGGARPGTPAAPSRSAGGRPAARTSGAEPRTSGGAAVARPRPPGGSPATRPRPPGGDSPPGKGGGDARS